MVGTLQHHALLPDRSMGPPGTMLMIPSEQAAFPKGAGHTHPFALSLYSPWHHHTRLNWRGTGWGENKRGNINVAMEKKLSMQAIFSPP